MYEKIIFFCYVIIMYLNVYNLMFSKLKKYTYNMYNILKIKLIIPHYYSSIKYSAHQVL